MDRMERAAVFYRARKNVMTVGSDKSGRGDRPTGASLENPTKPEMPRSTGRRFATNLNLE